MTIDIPFIFVALKEIVKAIPLTLALTFVPILAGALIGLAVTFIRMKNVKILTPIANFYVSFYRGTPAIMHIMIIYFASPKIIDYIINKLHLSFQSNSIPVVVFVLVALSLTAGSYFSEIIRSGISGVPSGQLEASFSIGMTTKQAMQRIVLPQAFAKSIPNITNLVIGFLHTTAIAYLVAQKELTGTANIVASQNLKYLEAFIAVAIVYWGISLIIELLSSLIEKRLNSYIKSAI